jgi:hypothetical protein
MRPLPQKSINLFWQAKMASRSLESLMNKIVLMICLISVGLLTACNAILGGIPSALPISTGIALSSSPVSRPTQTDGRLAASPTTVPTRTLVVSTTQEPITPRIEQRCLQVQTGVSESFLSGGQLLFWGLHLFAFNPRSHQLLPVLDPSAGQTVSSFGIVSPDREKLAFHTAEYDAHGKLLGYELWISSAGSKQVLASLPWNTSWLGFDGWVGNERLLVQSSAEPVGARIVINPFTGSSQEVKPSFPQISTGPYVDNHPAWDAVYDSSLTRVAYLKENTPQGFRGPALWDLQNNKELWSMGYPQSYHVEMVPRWSPDGTHLAVAAQKVTLDDVYKDEKLVLENHFDLFSVSRDGQATQWTHFSDDLTHQIRLERLNWSPNGQYISFWMLVDEDWFHLVVLDTTTQHVTDYCILDGGAALPAVWSPDSTQFIVASDGPDREHKFIVVDIVNNAAAQIPEVAGLSYVVGWMSTMP